MTAATAAPWSRKHLQRPSYGSQETYRLAANWMRPCATVADWGGAGGYLGRFLPDGVTYQVIDGTTQCDGSVLADLAHYREPSEGIVLRHVIDNTPDWRAVLINALDAFQQRLAVITFTPDAPVTRVAKIKSGWPVWTFNPADLMAVMGPLLVSWEDVRVTHPERVYYLERVPCAS